MIHLLLFYRRLHRLSRKSAAFWKSLLYDIVKCTCKFRSVGSRESIGPSLTARFSEVLNFVDIIDNCFIGADCPLTNKTMLMKIHLLFTSQRVVEKHRVVLLA